MEIRAFVLLGHAEEPAACRNRRPRTCSGRRPTQAVAAQVGQMPRYVTLMSETVKP
ncbi:hypothetical protein SBADM41S_04402 [Streptomyces badius]